MKVKTNLRAGQGGSAAVDTTVSSSTNSGGVNSGGVNSSSGGGKTVYVPPVYVGRCVGY
jgi:hypothetical protein